MLLFVCVMINELNDINRLVMIYVMVIWLWKELSGVEVMGLRNNPYNMYLGYLGGVLMLGGV